MNKKIINVLIVAISIFFASASPTYAKQMNLTEFGKEVASINAGAEEVYIIGDYAFTSNHVLTPQDLMLAARTIKVQDSTGQINTDRIYDEMAIQRVVRTYDNTTHQPNGWRAVANKEGTTPLPEQFNIRFIDYEVIEEDSELEVTIDVTDSQYLEELTKYHFDEKFNGADKLYSQNLALSKNGKLTGVVRTNSKVDETVYPDANVRTGFYVPVVVTVPNANKDTVITVDTWWGSKTIGYDEFELKGKDESGTVILLALKSDAENKKTKITVDVDGNGHDYAPASYTIDWSDLQFEILLYNTIASLAKPDVGIDFSKTASETNGQGVLTINSTVSNSHPIYYYRGKVDNNVIFNDLCWQIVRTTDDGGIRLIYNGKPDSEGRCNKTGNDAVSNGYSINTKYNNGNYSSPNEAGYTYSKISPGTLNRKTGMAHITNDAKYFDSYRYGSDVTYEGGKYTLVDPIEIPRSLFGDDENPWVGQEGVTAGNIDEVRQKIKDHPYTCIATKTVEGGLKECKSVAYIVDVETTFNNGASKTGAMYYYTFSEGKKYDQSYIDSFSNHTDGIKSAIKSQVDEFYDSNIGNNKKAADLVDKGAVYCNSRAVEDYGIFKLSADRFPGLQTKTIGSTIVNYTLLYKNYSNLLQGKDPTLDCNDEDKYSTLTSKGVEFYSPAAILSADEANYAGVVFRGNNNNEDGNTYLDSDINYWLMTPAYFGDLEVSTNGSPLNMLYVTSNGTFGTSFVVSPNYAKPVITLLGTATYVEGNGTDINPYKIIL